MFFEDILAPACSLCSLAVHPTTRSLPVAGAVFVASIDPDGPAARAGLLIGGIATTWNAKPVGRVRKIMRLLGTDSIGSSVDLGLLRGGASATLKVVIGERPVRPVIS